MRTWSFVLDKCAYLWRCLFFKLRTIPFQSANLTVPIAKVDALYHSWHLASWLILGWGKDSDFAKVLSCQYTFSSWQLQWWCELWVECPAWIRKGRCTCTFITFRDGNDSLAIGKYLADSGCRNMFRLSKCSKPIPPDRQLTPMSKCILYHTIFLHNKSRHSMPCRLWLSFDAFLHICYPIVKFAKSAKRWKTMATPPNGCWCNFWKYRIPKIAGGFMVEEKDSWWILCGGWKVGPTPLP